MITIKHNYNIEYTDDLINSLILQLQEYKMQTISIVCDESSSEKVEYLIDNLRKSFVLNNFCVAKRLCYNSIGLNQGYASIADNARIVLAVGGDEILNLAKMLASSMDLPLLYLPTNMPSCDTFLERSILFENNTPKIYNGAKIKCVIIEKSIIKNANNIGEIYAHSMAKSWCFLQDYLSSKFLCSQQLQPIILTKLKKIHKIASFLEINHQKNAFFLKNILELSIFLNEHQEFQDDALITAVYMKEFFYNPLPINLLVFFSCNVLTSISSAYFKHNLTSPLHTSLPDIHNLIKLNGANDIDLDTAYDGTAISPQKEHVYKLYKVEINTLLDTMQNFYAKCNSQLKKLLPNGGYEIYEKINFPDFEQACIHTALYNKSTFLNKMKMVNFL